MEMTGQTFVETMEIDKSTLSRWENDAQGIGGYTEKLLRHNVGALLSKDVPAITYNPATITKMRIHVRPEGFVMPEIEMYRVKVRSNCEVDEGWDKLAA